MYRNHKLYLLLFYLSLIHSSFTIDANTDLDGGGKERDNGCHPERDNWVCDGPDESKDYYDDFKSK